MSIFKLKNQTGTDSLQAWAGFTFPNNIAIDLIDASKYGDEIEYSLGINHEDLIGCKAGRFFENIKSLIKSGAWKLNDGDRDYYYDEAMYLLKWGTLQGFELKGETKTVTSHDICTPSTWYQKSTQVVDDVLTYKDGEFASLNKYWINLKDGFMYQEFELETKSPIIKLNGAVLNSDMYTINYAKGALKLHSGVVIDPQVDSLTASYWYAKDSTWIMQTDTTHLWRILKTEMQMDAGLIMVTPLIFEIIIDHPVYGNNFVAAKWVYKSMRDMVSGSNTGFYIPAFGGTRLDSGVNGGVVILPFDYNKPKDLPIGVNARIRVTTEGHIPPEGKFGTVTFYMDRIKL